jgi:hypothetical protein
MSDPELLRRLAPCGLSCEKCYAFSDGPIRRSSTELQARLGRFEPYAERFSVLVDRVFQNYPAFRDLLAHLTRADCPGCRAEGCKHPHCRILACTREKGVDFCGQCDEFPCERSGLEADPHLRARWVTMNERIREVGAAAYDRETHDLPRYI